MILSQFLPPNYSSATATSSSPVSADVYAKVNKIMQAQNTGAPKLNAALSSDNTTLSGLGKLLNALTSFQSVAQSLSGTGLYALASTSPSNVLSATTSSSSADSSYAIQVNQLAQSQTLLSKVQVSQDVAIGGVGTTAINFDFGTTAENVFTPNASAKSVIIHNGDNTLQGIASAINRAKIGVNATVTHSTSGYALSLISPTGSANSLRIGVKGDPALQDLLAYNPAGIKNMSQSGAAQNSALTVNGVAVSSSSNAVTSSVIGATTLNLTAIGSTTLVVTQDPSQLTKNVTNLVNMYNTLNASLKGLQRGDLKSDSAVAHIQSQLARVFSIGTSSTAGTSYLTLGNIGISTQKNGDLVIDVKKLQNTINTNPGGVAKLFTNKGKGIADNLERQIQSMVGSTGSITKEATAINKDILALNAKKSNLATALTAEANALVKTYSQQNSQGNSTVAKNWGSA